MSEHAAGPVVLALLDYYLPGVRAGGPVRSIQHLGERLNGELDLRVLTRDRDVGVGIPYAGIADGRWHPAGPVRVKYLPPRALGLRGMRRALRASPHDVLYLNSLFSPRFTFVPLLLRRLGQLPERPVVLAPRGELHPGALGTGEWGRWMPRMLAGRVPPPRVLKKGLYLRLCRAAGLLRGVVWQASGPDEARDIRRHAGPRARVMVAPDLGPRLSAPARTGARGKEPGRLRVVYLSRIVPKKNLLAAIDVLRGVTAQVDLEIYGPAEDEGYWNTCRAALRSLPQNVRARFAGPVAHEQVPGIFRGTHLLFLPTRGENFGHVILEALVEGCPVLISDQTPWRGLQARGAGWDLPLDQGGDIRAALEQCAAMDADAYTRLSRGAADFGRRYAADPAPEQENRTLFLAALAPAGCPAPVAALGQPRSVGAGAPLDGPVSSLPASQASRG